MNQTCTPEDQSTGSDEDEDDETILIIDDEDWDKDWIVWNAFIYQEQKLFNGCCVTSNCEKIYTNC